MSHDPWLEHAELYAAGALDGNELADFEAHVAQGCPACEGQLKHINEALTLLPRSLPQVSPPAAVRAALLERVARQASAVSPSITLRPRLRNPVGWWPVGAWACAALAVGLSVRLAGRERAIRQLQGTLSMLERRLAEQDAKMNSLVSSTTCLVQLDALPNMPAAQAKLLWNPATRKGLLMTEGLPQPSEGNMYELWALSGGEPMPAGLFTVDQQGRAQLHLSSLPEGKTFDTFAVTLEPAGGLPKPSGPMYILGKL